MQLQIVTRAPFSVTSLTFKFNIMKLILSDKVSKGLINLMLPNAYFKIVL